MYCIQISELILDSEKDDDVSSNFWRMISMPDRKDGVYSHEAMRKLPFNDIMAIF